jgi:hypothetical protein
MQVAFDGPDARSPDDLPARQSTYMPQTMPQTMEGEELDSKNSGTKSDTEDDWSSA